MGKNSMKLTSKHPSDKPLSILDEDWVKAPIVVGGTGGSGTRGVVDFLDKLGVYMVGSH
jgi:hypothetical protein